MNRLTGKENILVIDDDEDDFIIIREYIQSIPSTSYKIEWCKSYNDALHQLRTGYHDLYLVDYRLGARSGVDFLKEALNYNLDEPVVLLTGKGNHEVDIQAMHYGAVDYLVKTELSVEKMERCIRYALVNSVTLKALKASERKYRGIFEQSKDVVFVTDIELNFTDINAAIFLMLGYEKEEILQLNLCDLIEQAIHRQFLKQALQIQKEVNDWETILNTKEGEKKYCILTISLVADKRGAGYTQGIIHDITNLKKAEKATLQSEKLAAAGRLVRTIAHEVRNPLNNITLSVEQLKPATQDDQTELYIGIIQRNGKRINDLITELLNTSFPAENTLEKVSLQQIIDSVILASTDRLMLKHLKLQVNCPNNALMIMADKEKLKLALLNIVINAIEAMENENGSLSISLAEFNRQAILSISDNGCGISEENIAHLFEPYFTQKRNGVGLGLTFTLNILQAHKAEIEVISHPGLGTTFVITFTIN